MTELLRPWREAGVLSDADAHIAATLARLAGLGRRPDDAGHGDRGGRDGSGALDHDEALVVLGAALAARAPRLGHVCLDLLTVGQSVPAEVEGDADAMALAAIDALPWPDDVEAWRRALAASPLVAVALDGTIPEPAPGHGVPLVLDGTLLYLERYRVYEDRVAEELVRRAAAGEDGPQLSVAASSFAGAFAASVEQRRAAEAGARGLLSVVVGGPGTGKTTTVATMLALLLEADPTTRIALVAPTGKAAARMGESIGELAVRLRESGIEGAEALAGRLAAADVSTIHKRLVWRPDGTFRHRRSEPLPHDVVIVDETSMVSLPLMAHLLDAVRADARLVLVGDPGQLASVEAGSVLGDISGPAVDAALQGAPAPDGPVAACVSVLVESYRFPSESAVGRFAAAVRAGDADAAVSILADASAGSTSSTSASSASSSDDRSVASTSRTSPSSTHRSAGAVPGAEPGDDDDDGSGDAGDAGDAGDVRGAAGAGGVAGDAGDGNSGNSGDSVGGVQLAWRSAGADTVEGEAAIRGAALSGAQRTLVAAEEGDAEGALAALGEVRVLCAHRRGPHGVAWWNWRFEDWLSAGGPRLVGSYVGRPVLVTANDPLNGVSNGDLGVMVRTDDGVRVAFTDPGGVRLLAPSRLEALETVHAMTIHKSQGSEFDEVVVVLPPPDSRLATRELLYTAVTRARRVVTLVGGETALRRAIGNRVVRQTGLRRRLWPDAGCAVRPGSPPS